MPKIQNPPDSRNNAKRWRPPASTYQVRIETRFPTLCAEVAAQFEAGECTLHEAVDWCQDWASTRGLVELIGQDAVQWEIAKAFLPHRPDLGS